MNSAELTEIINRGEDSKHQFKADMTNMASLSQEFAELQRIFQNIALVHADEVPVDGLTIADLDEAYFTAFFERNFHENLDPNTMPLASLLQTMNLLKGETLNLAGALLFAKTRRLSCPYL